MWIVYTLVSHYLDIGSDNILIHHTLSELQ